MLQACLMVGAGSLTLASAGRSRTPGLWPSGSGDVPLGERLVYGRELRLLGLASAEREALLNIWSVDAPRPS
jgi:hypothetical protein